MTHRVGRNETFASDGKDMTRLEGAPSGGREGGVRGSRAGLRENL